MSCLMAWRRPRREHCWNHTLFARYTPLTRAHTTTDSYPTSIQTALRHFHGVCQISSITTSASASARAPEKNKKLIALSELSVSDWVSLLARKVLMKSVFCYRHAALPDAAAASAFTWREKKELETKQKQNTLHCSLDRLLLLPGLLSVLSRSTLQWCQFSICLKNV